MKKDEIVITQEQENQADRYINIFEQVLEIRKKYPKVFSFLKETYIPDWGKKPVPANRVVRHKVIADIYFADEQEREEIKEKVKNEK